MPRNSDLIPITPEKDIPLVDCHCHFPLEKPPRGIPFSYEKQYDEFIKLNGQFIITSIGYESLKYTKIFIKSHNNIYMTCGWGPQTVTYTPEDKHDNQFPKFIEFITKNAYEFVGIGEIGLDFHHAISFKNRDKQIKIFKQIIQETKHLSKPVVLHVRNAGPNDIDPDNPNDAYNEPDIVNKILLEILEDEGIPPKNVMWHCFSGPAHWGPKLAEKGYYISIPSSAYGFKRWRRNAVGIPLEQILTETDAAWQHPFKMGSFNTPSNVRYAVAAIAYLNDCSQMKVAENVLENAKLFFDM